MARLEIPRRDGHEPQPFEDIHNKLVQKGDALAFQIDVTATPKHNDDGILVQTVADYPLVEAIWQNDVKHPVLPDAASRAKLNPRQSIKFHFPKRQMGTDPTGS